MTPSATQQPATPNQVFSALYEAHHNQVYRYMLVRVNNRQDAHDLTAQTFLAAYENWDTYDSARPFINWVMGIARRKVIDFYRRDRETVALSDVPHLPTPKPLPEAQLQQQMKLERVAEAMQSLSEDRREAIALRLFAGLTNPEIADLMKKSTQAVAMLVHRALTDLQARLGEDL